MGLRNGDEGSMDTREDLRLAEETLRRGYPLIGDKFSFLRNERRNGWFSPHIQSLPKSKYTFVEGEKRMAELKSLFEFFFEERMGEFRLRIEVAD